MSQHPNPLLAELKEPSDVLSSLSPEESALLHRLLHKAMAQEQTQLGRSLNDALNVLPRLVRPAARKILFGR